MTESTIEILRRLDFYSALAVEAIALERLRHIEEEGWSPEHDDAHDKGELSGASWAVPCVRYIGDRIEEIRQSWGLAGVANSNDRLLKKGAQQ